MNLRVLWLLYGRNLRQVPRIPTVLVFGIMMPVIQLLLFGNIFDSITETPDFRAYEESLGHSVEYISFITPAIILLTCFLGMANSSAAFIVDLRTGYFDKLRTTPAGPGLMIAGRLFAEMTRVAGQATLILLIALGMGARVETGFLGGIAMIAMAVLFSAMTTGLMVMALAMKTRSDQATQSAFPLFFIFIFLSSAYVPATGLKDWLQELIKYNPIDYLIQGLRAMMIDSWSDAWADLLVAAACAVGIAMLFGLLNARVYRRMLG